jgi:uracil-DNA glycosylase
MNQLLSLLPHPWQSFLSTETSKDYFKTLDDFLQDQRKSHIIYPLEASTFEALALCAPKKTKVLILGQDPYHGPNQAHGLAFSVIAGQAFPPSLRNIFKELKSDLNIDPPLFGDLSRWGEQGVLLLNSVLSVQAQKAASHQNQGWEIFTNAIIQKLSQDEDKIVFILWGAFAQKKTSLIDQSKHLIISSPHPSPLSSYRGFFNSQPFSRCNLQLEEWHLKPIDWSL